MQLANSQGIGVLKDDLLRSSLMFAVGACDAYMCDAYADILSRVLRAKELETGIPIPDRLGNLKVPVIAIISNSTSGWRWRMAARELIEKESVLSLEQVKNLLNQFCNTKLLNKDTIERWILAAGAKKRHFGITATEYNNLLPAQKSVARKSAVEKFDALFDEIFQRRHDCIHNCDRPKVALQHISSGSAPKVIVDVEFLVTQINAILSSEFPSYLVTLGFNAVTRNRVLM